MSKQEKELYIYKGNYYQKVMVFQSKNIHLDKWEPCILYQSLKTGEHYARTVEDFESKFQKVSVQVDGVRTTDGFFVKDGMVMHDLVHRENKEG